MTIKLFIQAFLTVLFAPEVLNLLRSFGSPVAGTAAQLQPAFGLLDMATGSTPAPVSTPGAVPEPKQDPTPTQIIAAAVDKPVNWLFLALLAFALVFLVAQVRAAAHEATETTKDVLNEAKSATNSLANADESTRNISRRMKK